MLQYVPNDYECLLLVKPISVVS